MVAERAPALPESFIGRDEEVRSLVRLVADEEVRLITIIGLPGVGKTRLAAEVCAAVERELSRTSVFVPLADVTDPTAIAGAAAARRHRVIDPALIVFDNAEHLLRRGR